MNAKLQQASDHAMYLKDELQQALAKGTAVEAIVLLLLIENATHARNLIEQLINAREADAVKAPDDLPDQETSCYTCKHEERENYESPCKFCTAIARHPFTGQSNRWEPKP